jgi:hypothetical protein
MLFPCSNTPSVVTKADARLQAALLKHFILVEEIDRGATSIVVELNLPLGTDEQKTLAAAKIMALSEDSLRDLVIACQLNALRNYTPLFIHTFGWFLLNGIPSDWRDKIEDYPDSFEKDTLLCQVMDKEGKSFASSNAVFSELEFKSILFVLLHGIQMARQTLAFVHGDLTGRQVLLAVAKTEQLTLNTDTQVMVIAHGRFLPKLIDFGMSYTAIHAEPNEDSYSGSETSSDDLFGGQRGTIVQIQATNDVTSIVSLIHSRMRAQIGNRHSRKVQFTGAMLRIFERTFLDSAQYAAAKLAPATDSLCIERLLLESGYFNDIIKTRQSKPMVQKITRCMACGALATKQWEGTELTFCGTRCSTHWQPIGRIVPR